ncbi:SDR family oxidoreductase [Thorsellia kenyensis]|uniref:SDR family oxidoreductase n=1 Tax=Thorsellia kenyensis TaxID=1549888 RepID=A0ABV6CDR1_9GAMM
MVAKYSDLENKHILVTGASGDIGIAICNSFLNQGAIVHAVYNRDASQLEKIKAESDHSNNFFIYKSNVAEKESVTQLIDEISVNTKAIHVLVNNAGIYKDNIFSAMTDEDFEDVLKVNMFGTFYMTKKALPLLRHAKTASIVNVASVSGVTSSFGQTNYSAAKSGIIGFSRTLAAELAPRGIRVNTVAPGMIESRMVKKVPRQIVKGVLSAVPVKRLGEVHEVANVILFLSSEASSYVIGQTIVVDGGLIMR